MDDTLHGIIRSPIHRQIGFQDSSVSDLGKALKPYYKGGSETIHKKAAEFYLAQHVIGDLKARFHPHQPLGDMAPIVEACEVRMTDLCKRMVWYLLLICHRESRHVKHGEMSPGPIDNAYADLWDYTREELSGLGAEESHDALVHNPPDCTLGEYTEYLMMVFSKGLFSSQFGGMKWYEITKALQQFVTGTTTAEIMTDTAFTLSHNTGPIFNKGTLFGQNKEALMRVLDVQRAGMVPQYLMEEGDKFNTCISLVELMDMLLKARPSLFEPGRVDWLKVMELGAVGSYHHLVHKEGPTKAAASWKPSTKVQVLPNCYIRKIEMERVV